MRNYIDEFIAKNGIKNLLDVFHHDLTRLKYIQDQYKPSYSHVASLLCTQVEQVASILFHLWSYHPVRFPFFLFIHLTNRFHSRISPTLEPKSPSSPPFQPLSSRAFSPAVIYSSCTQSYKISITPKHPMQFRHPPFFTLFLLHCVPPSIPSYP